MEEHVKDKLFEIDLAALQAILVGLRDEATERTGRQCVDVMLSTSDSALFFHFEFPDKQFIVQGVPISKINRTNNNLEIVRGVLQYVFEKLEQAERRAEANE